MKTRFINYKTEYFILQYLAIQSKLFKN